MPARPIRHRTGSPLRGATPTAGRGKTAAGLRYRHMCRGELSIRVVPARAEPVIGRRFAPTRWLGRDDVNLSIKNNDAAYRLAGFHRRKALVDLGPLQLPPDPVPHV